MVWYFIGVYIVNRTLHGHLEIRNFSSRVEKILQHSKRNFVSPRGHVISSISDLLVCCSSKVMLLVRILPYNMASFAIYLPFSPTLYIYVKFNSHSRISWMQK